MRFVAPSGSIRDCSRELCARRPELASELRALHEVHALLSSAGRAVERGEEPPAPDLPGYECRRLLGRGGTGEVWEAFDSGLGRLVAVKLLSREAHGSERARERFRREAASAARLRHRHLVTVFAFGEHEGRAFLVQELVPGGRTLRDEIDELRRTAVVPARHERRTAERFLALADALAAVHAAGIVHRDVKPQNVLLDEHGEPKLADFGLARSDQDLGLTASHEFLGTYGYASPEQLESGAGHVGPLSDVFSLGVTLYECLVLERPFRGESVAELTRAILGSEPASARERRPAIPRDLAVDLRQGPREAARAALREHGSAA